MVLENMFDSSNMSLPYHSRSNQGKSLATQTGVGEAKPQLIKIWFEDIKKANHKIGFF